MHIEALKKGDIVLSVSQTESLMKYGKAAGTGKAYANGTLPPSVSALSNAYKIGSMSGSGGFVAGATDYNPSGSYSSSTPVSSTQTSAQEVSQAVESASEAAEDLYDFVEILLDRTKEVTEKLTDSIEDAVGLAEKMSTNSSTLSQIQKEISVNQQAYQRYIEQANAVQLSDTYISQIRDGSLNIENITDEDLKKKIDSYKQWYEKAKNCQDTILQLQKDEKDLALARLEYIEEYYDAIVSLNDAYKEVNDSRIELNDSLGNSAIGQDVQNYLKSSYDKQYDSYNQALQQLADYQNEFNELVKNGYIEKGSDAWYEGQQKIQEFTQQIDESSIALIELEDKIRAIDYTKLQQVIDGADRRTSQLQNAQSLAEARDEFIGRKELQKQINSLDKSINANYQLRAKKIKEQNLYNVGSTRYQELAKEIADLDNDIYKQLEDIEDFKDQIFEAEFFDYEKEQQNLEYFIGELEDFSRLLNEDAFFDKTGAFTDEAYAKISLLADAMAKSKQETANANKALQKLDEMFKNGLISETEYEEKQKELLDTVRDSAIATNDYKNELLDLYKQQMSKENESLKENIELQKQRLENTKDYWDYAESLKSKTKTVDELESQIAALQGVNNSQAKAELKRLIAQRDEAQKDLDDTKRDHAYNMQMDGYDAMAESLDQSLEDIEYNITHSSEKQLQVVQSMLNQMVASYQEAYGKINSIISETGFSGTSSFDDTVSNVGTQYGASNVASNATQSQSTVKPSGSASNINSNNVSHGNHDAIEDDLAKEPNTTNRLVAELKVSKSSVKLEEGKSTTISTSIRPTDAKNKTLSWGSSNTSIAKVSNGTIKALKPGSCQIVVSTTDGSGISATIAVTVTKKPEPPKPQTPQQNTSTGDGVPKVGDVVTLKAGQQYYSSSWGLEPLGSIYAGVPNGVVIDSYSNKKYGGTISNTGDYDVHIKSADGKYGDLGWVRLDQLEGYASGAKRIDKDQWAWTQEHGKGELIMRQSDHAILTHLNQGDSVFSHEQVQRLWDLSNENFNNLWNVNLPTSTLPDIVNRNDMSQNIEVHIGDNMESMFTIEGNVTKDAIPGLEKAIDKLIPKISDKLGIYLKGEMRKM